MGVSASQKFSILKLRYVLRSIKFSSKIEKDSSSKVSAYDVMRKLNIETGIVLNHLHNVGYKKTLDRMNFHPTRNEIVMSDEKDCGPRWMKWLANLGLMAHKIMFSV